MNARRAVAAALIGVALVAGLVAAQTSTPQTLIVQGYLSDRLSGQPVPANGTFSMTFRLFDAELGGLLLGTVGPLSVDAIDGLYAAELPFGAAAFDGAERYLEIEVEGEVLAPRLHVASTPFAYTADSLGGFSAADLDESAEIADALADHDASPAAHPGLADAAVAAHAALPDAHREHASLEESAEIVDALADHAAMADPHPVYVKRSGDTINGSLAVAAPSPGALALSAPDDVLVSFTPGTGSPHTLGWQESQSTFALSDGLALDNARLLRWPMISGPSAGVATFSFSKVAATPPGQLEHPDGEYDETFQFCYNCRPDGSTFQADPTQHAWNQKFESSYWNSGAQREQLEVNWNYTEPGGFKWRPFAFVLQTTANCSGGPQNGEPCISPQQISDCEGGGGVCQGDNWTKWDWDSSPFGYCSVDHSIVCRAADDCPSGSCYRTSDLSLENGRGRLFSRQGLVVDVVQPGTSTDTAYEALEVKQSIEPLDASRPYAGLSLTSTFGDEAQPDSAPTSWLGIEAAQVFDGSSTDGRHVVERMVGIEVRQALSQTAAAGPGAGDTVPVLSGMSWRLQPDGNDLSVGTVSGLRLETPDPLDNVNPVAITELDGIRVDDLKGYGEVNRAIRVASQSSGDGDAGNLHMEGGGATTGHLRLGDGHVWYDGGSNTLRFKDASAGPPPSSDGDGTPLHAPPGMSDEWGDAMWGAAGGTVDTGTKVCAQAGLGCVGAHDLVAGRDRNCGYSNWSGAYFIAFCK